MIEIIQAKNMDEILELREQYMNGLPLAQDLNTEENVWECQYYKIIMDSAYVGYFCADKDKTLWEFYLIRSVLISSQIIFQYLISSNYITDAECKSYDPVLMSLCLDYHKKAACSAYLFRSVSDVSYTLDYFKHVSFRLATKEDYNSLNEIDYIAEGVNFFHDLKEDIHKGEVLVFYEDQEMIGAGTCKKIWHNNNYYDIGMVVPKKHRHKGVGTYIIIKLKEYCRDNNFIPVCGCWYYHHSSKKTLEKAGFIADHRMIRFTF